MASEMRSQILSGCPSDTDSLVNTKSLFSKRQPSSNGRIGDPAWVVVVESRIAAVKPDLVSGRRCGRQDGAAASPARPRPLRRAPLPNRTGDGARRDYRSDNKRR